MSSPDSTIVVHTSTSALAAQEVEHHLLELPLVHLAVGHGHARARARSRGRARRSRRSCPRGCAGRRPGRSRSSSRSIACVHELLVVLADVGARPAAGPPAASRSPRCRAGRRATSAACAGSAWPTATARPPAACSWRSSSFCFTPKRCSSSTISRPRSFGRTSRESSRWVPIRMSTLPARNSSSASLHLRGGAEARGHLDLERVVAHALGEGAEVLLGEHGGGHEEHHLLAVRHRLERRPQGHLGLAVAHVAADQAVHRARLLHVGAHGLDRLELVGRLAVGEGAPRTPICHSPSCGNACPARRLRSA